MSYFAHVSVRVKNENLGYLTWRVAFTERDKEDHGIAELDPIQIAITEKEMY